MPEPAIKLQIYNSEFSNREFNSNAAFLPISTISTRTIAADDFIFLLVDKVRTLTGQWLLVPDQPVSELMGRQQKPEATKGKKKSISESTTR